MYNIFTDDDLNTVRDCTPEELELLDKAGLMKRANAKRASRTPNRYGTPVTPEKAAEHDLPKGDRRCNSGEGPAIVPNHMLKEHELKVQAIEQVANEPIELALSKDMVDLCKRSDLNQLGLVTRMWLQAMKQRIAFSNRIRAVSHSQPEYIEDWKPELPHAMLQYFFNQSYRMEEQLKQAVEIMVKKTPMWGWLKYITGIGPSLAARLMCTFVVREHYSSYTAIDPKTNKEKEVILEPVGITAGSWWNFCGMLDPEEYQWEKGEKRPYNVEAKSLVFLVGSQFIMSKRRGGESNLYATLYFNQFLPEEIEKNERGENAAYCARALKNKNVGMRSADTIKYYKQGKIPPLQVIARARRKVFKLFLAHMHQVYYWLYLGKEAPNPYVFEHLGHAHKVDIPCWDYENFCPRKPLWKKDDEPDDMKIKYDEE